MGLHIALAPPHPLPASSEERFLLKRSSPSIYSQHLAEHQKTPGRQGCLINRSWDVTAKEPSVPQGPPPHLDSPCPQVCLHRRPARAQGLQEVDPGDGRGTCTIHQPAVPPPGHHARTSASPRGVSGPRRCRRPQSGLSLEYVGPGGCLSGATPWAALWGPHPWWHRGCADGLKALYTPTKQILRNTCCEPSG